MTSEGAVGLGPPRMVPSEEWKNDSPCLVCRETPGLSRECEFCPHNTPLTYDTPAPPSVPVRPPASSSDDPTSPSHYARFPVQPLDFIQQNRFDFLTGNIIKYVVRAPYKGQRLLDLRKARVYLDKLIAAAEAEAP